MDVLARRATVDRAAMAVFEYTPTTGRRRLTDDTATAREIAEVVLEAADHWGAVDLIRRFAAHDLPGNPPDALLDLFIAAEDFVREHDADGGR